MRAFCLSVIGFCLSQQVYGLELPDLLQSARQHHPQILASLEKNNTSRGDIQISQGAFDWEMNQKIVDRSGLYEGRYVDTNISRRLQDSNIRVYSGYRLSEGALPSYEDSMNSYRGGEFNAGIMFSLLKDRLIDKDRYKLRQSSLKLEQSQNYVRLVMLKTQYEAMKAYLEWVAIGQSIDQVEKLLALSIKRQKAFTQKNKAGDIADIYLTENKQYILKRQIELTQLKQEWQNKATALSLFYRDDRGNPKIPTRTDMPKDFPKLPPILPDNMHNEMAYLQSHSPDLIALKINQKMQDNTIELGENSLLPKVDVILEGTDNVGGYQKKPAGNDVKLGLSITVPLQTNYAQGTIAKAESEKNKLAFEQKWMLEKIATQLKIIADNHHVIKEYQDLLRQEVNLAYKMQRAEYRKFDEGLSDFFVVNLREEKTIETELKYIKSKLDFWKNMAAYYFATLKYEEMAL
jgi:outer membrane protein TolC